VAALDGAVLILAALPLMIDIDPWLTLWSLLSLPGITLLVLGFGNRMHRGYRDVQQFLGKLSIFVQESLAGIRVIQAHGQEATRQARFEELSAEYMRKNLVTARLSGVLWPLIAVLSGLASAVVLCGNRSGRTADKFAAAGLTPLPAKVVGAPLIRECFASLECRVADRQLVETYNFFVLEVVKAWIDPAVKDPRTLHHRGRGAFMVAGETIWLRSKMK